MKGLTMPDVELAEAEIETVDTDLELLCQLMTELRQNDPEAFERIAGRLFANRR
jgi:hypothetical protein